MVNMPETCGLCGSEERLTAPVKEVICNINPFFPIIIITENGDSENQNRICSTCILDITLLEEVVNKYKTVSSIPEDDKCYLCGKDEITFRVTGELYIPIKVIEESFKRKKILPDDFGNDFWENAMRHLNKRKVCHECYFLIDTTYELYQKVKLIDKDIEDIVSQVTVLEYDEESSSDEDSDFDNDDKNDSDFEDGSEAYEESDVDIKDVINGLKTEMKFELASDGSYHTDSDSEIDQHAIIRRIKEEQADEDEIVQGEDHDGQSSDAPVRIKEEPIDSCDEEVPLTRRRTRLTKTRKATENNRIVKNPRNKDRKAKARRPYNISDDDLENFEENESLQRDSENDNSNIEDTFNSNELRQHSRSRKRGQTSNKGNNFSEKTSVRVKTEPQSDEDQELDGLDNELSERDEGDRSEGQLDDNENESVDFTQNLRKQKQPSKLAKRKKTSKKQSRSKRTNLQVENEINKFPSKHVALNSQESLMREHQDEDKMDKQVGEKRTEKEQNSSCSWCSAPRPANSYLCLSCNDKQKIAFAGIQSGRTCSIVLVRVKLPDTENSCDNIKRDSEYLEQEPINDVDESLSADFHNDVVRSRKRSREHSECSSLSENNSQTSSPRKRTKSDFDNSVSESKSLSLSNESYMGNSVIQNHAISMNSDCNSSGSKKRKRTSSVSSSVSSDFDTKSLCSNTSRNTRPKKSSPNSAVSSNLTVQNLNSVEQSIDKINIGSNLSQSLVNRNSTEQFQVNENITENLKSLTPSKLPIHSGSDDEKEASRNDKRSGNELDSDEENSITDKYRSQGPNVFKVLKDKKLKNARGWSVKLDKVLVPEITVNSDARPLAHNTDDNLDSESESSVVEENMTKEESEVDDQSDVPKNISSNDDNGCNSLIINSDSVCEPDLESKTVAEKEVPDQVNSDARPLVQNTDDNLDSESESLVVEENMTKEESEVDDQSDVPKNISSNDDNGCNSLIINSDSVCEPDLESKTVAEKEVPDQSELKVDQSDEVSKQLSNAATNDPLKTNSDSPSKRDSETKVVQSCDNIIEYKSNSEVDVQSDFPNCVSSNGVNASSSVIINSDDALRLDPESNSLVDEISKSQSGSVIDVQQDLPNHISDDACSPLTNNSDSPDKQVSEPEVLLGNDSIAGNKSKPDLEVDVPMPMDCQESDAVLLNEASYSRESKDNSVQFHNAISNQSSDVEHKNLKDSINHKVTSSESELSDEENMSIGTDKHLVENSTGDSHGHINGTSEKIVSE